jgi:hypothetical protein
VMETDHGHWEVASQSQGGAPHSVNGSCDCDWLHFHPGNRCTHMLAVLLQRKALLLMEPEPEPTPVPPEPAPAIEPVPASIPAQHIIYLHGKPFIRYAGLLAMAHEWGLVSLKARFISATDALALAEAEAIFPDGRTYSECADSTPGNVPPHIRPHFPRMALTRAKARCLCAVKAA